MSPAAVHRLSFAGADSARLHTVGALDHRSVSAAGNGYRLGRLCGSMALIDEKRNGADGGRSGFLDTDRRLVCLAVITATDEAITTPKWKLRVKEMHLIRIFVASL
jgi:hypothetical protein